MRPSRLLRFSSLSVAALAAAAGLGACATQRPAGSASDAGAVPAEAYAPADDDVSPLGLYLAGATALAADESGPAAGLFAQASAAAPDQEALREHAFTTNLLAGRIAEAVRFTPLPGEGPPSGVALGRLARAVDTLADGRGREAEALVADGAVGEPYADAAALIRPWAAASAGDLKAALAAPKPPSTDSLTISFDRLNRARLLERAGRSGEAEAMFAKLAAGKQTLLTQAYGGFLERHGRKAQAVKLYDAALAAAPDVSLEAARARAASNAPPPPQPSVRQAAAEALIGPAAAAIDTHQLEVGLIYVRLALRLDPGLAQAWLVVGDALASSGDAEGAAAAYRSVPDDAPEKAGAWDRLAVAQDQAGDKAGALELAEKAAKRAPGDSDVQALYAEMLRENDRNADAVAVLDPLIAARGDGRPGQRLYFLRGAAEERAGRWPAAEADLKKALAFKPDDPEVLNYLGFAWADRGEHLNEALPMLEKALAADPNQGAVIDSVGWAHFKLGDYKLAVHDLEHAVSLEPADPQINDHLGDAYWRVGRKLEAGYQWRRVLTLDPDAPTRAGAEAKLRNGAAAPAAVPHLGDVTSRLAPAKVNLFLHVGPVAADGYHPVASLMVFADIGDRVRLEPADRAEFVVEGEFAAELADTPPERNLAWRAAHALLARIGRPDAGFRLTLDKVLPIAAGLGGGSSDAGAALRLLRDAMAPDLADDVLAGIAAGLGADGPACLFARPAVGTGRGEVLAAAPPLPSLHAVLANPREPSPTAAVYRAYDAAAPAAADLPPLEGLDDLEALLDRLRRARNDLQAPAASLSPAIVEALELVGRQPEARLTRLSGSGATVFALARDAVEARTLAARLSRERPRWWVRACRLGDPWLPTG